MTDIPADLILTGYFRFAVRVDASSDQPLSIDWLGDRAQAKALLHAVMSMPLFASNLKVGRADDGAWVAITAATSDKLVAENRDVIVELQDRVEGERNVFVQLNLSEGYAEISIQVTAAALAGHQATALGDFATFAASARTAMGSVAGLQVGHIRVDFAQRDFEYPRSRPPRESNNYPPRSIVTVLEPAFHDTDHPFAHPADVGRLLHPAPPAPATMATMGPLVVVTWSKSLVMDDLVAAASAHEGWVDDRVSPDLADGFNELGDQRESWGGAKAAPPLTLYAPRWKVGYKTVLVSPDGSIEPTAWATAKQILDAEALPDGTSVASVKLVVPLREHVFVIAAQAQAAGFAAVLYADDKGVFWNPDPPGCWRSAPLFLE